MERRAPGRYGRRMSNRSLAVAVFGVTITLLTAPAFAEGARADEAFAHGLELQQAKQYADAFAAFRTAYQMQPTPQSLLHIAECEMALGRLVRAEDHLRALVDAKIPEDAPPELLDAQSQSRVELAELSPRVRVGILTLHVFPPNEEGLLVTVDGWPLNKTQLGSPQRVDAGSHVVVIAANDRLPVTRTVTVPEGRAVDAQLSLGVFAPSSTNAQEPSRKLSPSLVTGGIVVAVLGGAAVVGSGIYFVGAEAACFMTCRPDPGGNAAAGAIALAGLGAAVLIGVPMIVIGSQKVSPRVAVSPRGVRLAWAF